MRATDANGYDCTHVGVEQNVMVLRLSPRRWAWQPYHELYVSLDVRPGSSAARSRGKRVQNLKGPRHTATIALSDAARKR